MTSFDLRSYQMKDTRKMWQLFAVLDYMTSYDSELMPDYMTSYDSELMPDSDNMGKNMGHLTLRP